MQSAGCAPSIAKPDFSSVASRLLASLEQAREDPHTRINNPLLHGCAIARRRCDLQNVSGHIRQESSSKLVECQCSGPSPSERSRSGCDEKRLLAFTCCVITRRGESCSRWLSRCKRRSCRSRGFTFLTCTGCLVAAGDRGAPGWNDHDSNHQGLTAAFVITMLAVSAK